MSGQAQTAELTIAFDPCFAAFAAGFLLGIWLTIGAYMWVQRRKPSE